jgi:hypothetical protein
MSASNLKQVVFCPDCGGVIGATGPTEFGHACKCFADAPKPKPAAPPADAVSLRDDLDDDVVAPSPREDTASTGEAAPSEQPKVEKLCVGCGKNVAGHRRVKDSRGYFCLDCARKESLAKKPQGAKCPKCGRIVKEESMGALDGERMCQRCLREARELARPGSKRFRKIDEKHFEKASKTQLYVLVAIALVLGVLMLMGWLNRG